MTHTYAHTNRVLKGWENTKAAAATAVAVQKRLNYGKGGKRAREREA